MAIKEFARGDLLPALKQGVLRLYGTEFSPFAHRVRLILSVKKLEFEDINISLREKPEWLRQKNLMGKVPILEYNGHTINESLVICDYLDEAHPDPSLYPQDPLLRAREKSLANIFNKQVSNTMLRMGFNPGSFKENLALVTTTLDAFDKELSDRNTDYFGGNAPGMTDYMMWPSVERLAAIDFITKERFKVNLQNQSTLKQWAERMKRNSNVQKYYFSGEEHAQHITVMMDRREKKYGIKKGSLDPSTNT